MSGKQKKNVVRIFVSSTFRDMNKERDYLVNVVYPKLRSIARSRGVYVTIIDLRWGITENDLAKIIERCLAEIDEARPHFIGILGNRYGTVPSKEQVDKLKVDKTLKDKWTQEGYSITHMEIDYAVFLKPEMAKYSYFYFKSDKASTEKQDDSENLRKLQDLKSKIRVKDSPWHWRDKEFENPVELGEQIVEDFIKMLDENYPEQSISQLDQINLIHSQYKMELLNNYVEDKKTLKEILEKLEKERRVVVTGEVGIGKSATLARLSEIYRGEKPNAFVFEHYIGAGGRETSKDIALHLLQELKKRLESNGIKIDEEIPNEEDKIYAMLSRWLSLLPNKEDALIIIDGLDQLPEARELLFVSYLNEVKVLASCRDNTEQFNYLVNLGFRKYVLSSLGIEQREEIIRRVLKAAGKELTEDQIKRIVKEEMAGNPLYLRTLLNMLLGIYEMKEEKESQNEFMDRMIGKYLVRSLEDLYGVMVGELRRVMYMYFGNDKSVLEFLKLIAVSRSGLSENEVVGISSDILPAYLSVMRNYLDYNLANKNDLLDFMHESLRDMVKKLFKDKGEEVEYRRKIYNYFSKQEVDERQIYEAPYQLYMVGDRDEIRKYLSNVNVLKLFLREYPNNRFYELVNYVTFGFGKDCENMMFSDKVTGVQDNKERADILNDLGILMGSLGCFDEALNFYNEALSIYEKFYGRDHPNVADTLNNIGAIYEEKGELDKALEYYNEALSIKEKVYGRDHPDVAGTLHNIGAIYEEKGELDKALKYYNEALSIREKVYGRNHPDVAGTLHNIGLVYKEKGEFDKALEYYNEALNIYDKVYGRDHPNVAVSLNNIGNVYVNKGDYDKALEYYNEALNIYDKVYGRDHPNVAVSLNNIGNVYEEKGELDKALKYYNEALSIKEKVYGRDHPDVAGTLHNIGAIYEEKGELDKALKYYNEALSIREKVYGRNHPDVAGTLHNIGLVYKEKGEFDKALEYYNEALSIREKVYGRDHPKVADTLNNIGNVYVNKGDYDKALEYYNEALSIREKVYGRNHPDVAGTLHNIGLVYKEKGDYDKALEYYNEALSIREKVYGRNRPEFATTLIAIGYIYLEKGDYDGAIKACSEALDIFRRFNLNYYANLASQCVEMARRGERG
ncbi:tetratricopeptide repeat protein [Sulfolobus sp. E5-1-F]|uniref:tetratricopeptide repeat protein n=1 Tax=Saccharolobus sp. E5-1-F TaxID=2663019 RepID=UPI0012972F9F|nr:tetratricopeptide repeat protein [Sulfolobus sp. E5-1-F]QGA53909.1 tetratricopeptide repeat protein [Sulfolobus sp. E5-1-F]